MGLISIIRKYKLKSHNLRVLMLGLDNSGKTSITHALLNDEINKVTPTMGFNIETLKWFDDFTLDIWDIGGQVTLRRFWNNYFDSTDALIWVVDVADIDRLNESFEELTNILKYQGIRGSNLLIWINKVDLIDDGELNAVEDKVIKNLSLNQLTNEYKVICCSAYTKKGLKEGIDWVVNAYKERYNL